jgi:branched-subunit amino acid ABC-type transport system permease component
MEGGQAITVAALSITFLVGLSRAMILFIVTSGLSFVLGVLRVPNVAPVRLSPTASLRYLAAGQSASGWR